MAVEESSFVLPNLRIEIDNDFVEEMETDVLSDSKRSPANIPGEDFEDGEISDSQDSDRPIQRKAGGDLPMEMPIGLGLPEREKRYQNKGGGFVTGVDIFGEEEQSKLGVRAKRFGLDPSQLKPLTELELEKLYESVGVNNDEEGSEKKQYRLNSLHMRGTEDLSTEDIFSYFKAYGPASIEWINDYSCNVVWVDDTSAARALLGLSRPVRGVAEKERTETAAPATPAAPLDKEIISDGTQEVVVVVTHEEEDEDDDDVAMGDSTESRQTDQATGKADTDRNADETAVDVSSITIPIPPGKWRMGVAHPKARNILLRFSARSDKKHPRAEKMSQYYKKYGNPNYGGIVGILTESRKRRFRRNEHRPPPRQPQADDNSDEFTGSLLHPKNPWGDLAKEWSGTKQTPEEYQVPKSMQNRSILERIGSLTTRPQSDSADSQSEDSGAEGDRLTRSKVPRMRMYADDEEVKIEKRRALQKIKLLDDNSDDERSNSSAVRDDLRHKLRREGRSTVEETIHSALHFSSSIQRRRDERERSVEDERNSADRALGRNYINRTTLTERESVPRSAARRQDEPEAERNPPRLSSSVQRTHPSVAHRLSSTVQRNQSSDAQRLTSSVQRLQTREAPRFRAELRSPPRISSTVWSRLRHGQTEDNSLSDEEYEVDRRRKNTPESDIHSECDSDEPVVQRKKLEMGFAGDLRSKLNSKKTVKQEESPVRPKSPLQIEIDNDEYYRLIGTSESDNE